MTGTVELTKAELTDLLAAVMEYNGYQMIDLTITEDGGAICRVNVPPIEVKITRESDADRLRDLLYPKVESQWNFRNQTS